MARQLGLVRYRHGFGWDERDVIAKDGTIVNFKQDRGGDMIYGIRLDVGQRDVMFSIKSQDGDCFKRISKSPTKVSLPEDLFKV